jgi:uncharacterized protein (TIGR00255 family)
MITSMTGYGRGVAQAGQREVMVEVRSVNNRFLDVVPRLPKSISGYEANIKELVGKSISRGRVNIWVSVNGTEDKYTNLSLDRELASTFVRLTRELKQEFNLAGDIGIDQIIGLPDIITYNNPETLDEELWEKTRKALDLALTDLTEMRKHEGNNLKIDLAARINDIDSAIDAVEKKSRENPQLELDRLRIRISKLISPDMVDEGRMESELAIIADRMDVTEECVRFKSHNQVFLEALDSEKAEGRKLNFLLQEMNREANTIGSKCSDSVIAHLVVEIKEQVEKLREQIQNIE